MEAETEAEAEAEAEETFVSAPESTGGGAPVAGTPPLARHGSLLGFARG